MSDIPEALARLQVPDGWARSEGTWIFIDPRHVVEFTDEGWAIQHPLACRDDMLGCQFHKYIRNDAKHRGEPPVAPGRYYVTLTPELAFEPA